MVLYEHVLNCAVKLQWALRRDLQWRIAERNTAYVLYVLWTWLLA